MAGTPDSEAAVPEELLPDGTTSPGQRWYRLQVLGGVLLTAIGLPVWTLYFGLGWSTDRIGDVTAEALLATPVPASVWFGVVLIALALPVLATAFLAKDLSRRGVDLRVWVWPAVALLCINTWPVYWLVVWIFHRRRREVRG